ncbi:MAG TPA: hypothetical protein PKE49_04415 [Leptospiraceae bacterium]|jgi:hypothetical protein|nr:hypothetical protein [Leptospirales bacterium]HMU84252.1 hypothetical protein [Leptospiraceae bacterium]HMX55741.1 hypothetical protein [Leptospiraceae bacterium]HMY46533.1 hypothetical protein [Leptospiraceae bacterium]HMZ35818.1 hypothetical protein [Leptospiraceae bacterium]
MKLTALVAIGSALLLSACETYKMGTVSVLPAKTGTEYELVTTAAMKAHNRPIIFGVTFGEEKNFMDVMNDLQASAGCALLKKVEMRQYAVTYLGFGSNTTSVKGECYKVKGK